MKDRYGVVEENHVLLDNLGKQGLSHEDIDTIILSHLHFDHAGGLLAPWQENSKPALLFPNATIYVGNKQWQRAKHPHPRDKASYIPELQDLLEKSGRLKIIQNPSDNPFPDLLEFRWSDGHTPGLMLSMVKTKSGPLLYASDLIPGVPWVHLPIVMAYDRFPEILVEEKQTIFDELLAQNGFLFFVHDAQTACGKLERDEKEKYSVTAVDLNAFSG
jgi:glyoxylase-like metal-dependent hydrolase (beta-lactamase superfamily II)